MGESRGSATTTDLSDLALQDTVDAALAIAKVTAPDPSAVLASMIRLFTMSLIYSSIIRGRLVQNKQSIWRLRSKQRGVMKILESQTQRGMRIFDPRVSIHATSEGLMVSQPTSIHGMSCMLLAEDGESRERSYAYTQSRRSDQLMPPEAVGREAAQKTIARLNPRKCQTAETQYCLFQRLLQAYCRALQVRLAVWRCIGSRVICSIDWELRYSRMGHTRRKSFATLCNRVFGLRCRWVTNTEAGVCH